MVESLTHTLTPPQRKVVHEIVVCISRGSYDQALKALDFSTPSLPIPQEHFLRKMLERLKRMNKTESLIDCERFLSELQLPNLNTDVITNMDTHMPHRLLDRIYERMLTLSFDDFYKQLEHIQWVEHNIIRNAMTLYEHCTRLQAAQVKVKNLEAKTTAKSELYALYALLIPLTIYLGSFFF